MSMLWLRVDGCPRGCASAADTLDRLAERVEESGRLLVRDAHLAPMTYDGVAADAFRARCASEAPVVEALGSDTRGLARALRELGRDLADVEAVMDTLRAQAAPHLRTLPDRILAPESPRAFQEDLPGWACWDRIVPLHADARRLERQAQVTWASAVGHFTGQGIMRTTYEPDRGPHLTRR